MHAIEFTARVCEGTIEVPEELRGQLTDVVRVILVPEGGSQESPDIVDELLERPLRVPGFVPLTREEVHAER